MTLSYKYCIRFLFYSYDCNDFINKNQNITLYLKNTSLLFAEVTIIPTYDTDALGYWVAANEDALIANKIDLAPSAIRCTINLQDHETSCNAYRLEF